jgi:hypothetical protein
VRHQRTLRVLVTVAVLIGLSWSAPASAEQFTATWSHVPTTPPVPPPPSPFYDCPTWGGGGLICERIWDQGLEISSSASLPMYGDFGPFFDAFGFRLPLESEIGFDSGLFQIVPECLPGIEPCFETFSPLRLLASPFMSGPFQGGMFVRSSKGGLITTAGGVVNFTGPEWTDITGMEIGLFLPDSCSEPENEFDCFGLWERGLSIGQLTFTAEPIPEPGSVLLLGLGLLAAGRRQRRR